MFQLACLNLKKLSTRGADDLSPLPFKDNNEAMHSNLLNSLVSFS